MTSTDSSTSAAERRWLEGWTTGPTEPEGTGLARQTPAPDLTLPDETGAVRHLSEFWSGGPALLMFWRHYGCGCGVERAKRLVAEYPAYREAGLSPVIIAQGEPARAAAYRDRHDLPVPILSDHGHSAYDAYGLGQWSPERVLYDAPQEFLRHPLALGAQLQDDRRAEGRPLVDDPWRAVGEFVVHANGRIRLSHVYQYCEDFPDARVLISAAQLDRAGDALSQV